ncbi:MAG: hypothetical protein ACRDX8_06795 [Acidimicrobiales bacterium]
MVIAVALPCEEGSQRFGPLSRVARDEPAHLGYLVLRATLAGVPILLGVDKFVNWMTYWPKYLLIGFPHLLRVSPQRFVYGVGVIEIAAGLGVLVVPRPRGSSHARGRQPSPDINAGAQGK